MGRKFAICVATVAAGDCAIIVRTVGDAFAMAPLLAIEAYLRCVGREGGRAYLVCGLTKRNANLSVETLGSFDDSVRGSAGLRRKLPWASSTKPACVASARTTASSMRCRVLPSAMPVPG